MSDLREGFIWAVGIEDTIIGTPLRRGQRLDEYALTGHSDRWRSDLDLAKAAGATAIRYGIPWHEANPAPGRFEWDRADRVLAYASGELGFEIILDLVHYGTPAWLEGAFADPSYASAIAEYGGELAARYRGVVGSYTPLNEPLVTASFCGLRGVWPPYLVGDEGWAQVVVSVADGIQQTTRAIRQADPDARIVHVEAVQLFSTADVSLAEAVLELQERTWLPTDLVVGRLGVDGANWLEQQGISEQTLARVAAGAVSLDLLGLNYYPELSPRELVRVDGKVVQVAEDRGARGLIEAAESFHQRYRLPLMITETAVEGGDEHRARWLNDVVAALQVLDRDSVPVVGLTWWPLFDFVDWSWASGGDTVEEFFVRDNGGTPVPVAPMGTPGGDVDPFLRRMGLYRLARDGGGALAPVATGAVESFRKHAKRLDSGRALEEVE